MAVSFGVERRSSGRTMSPRSLGSVLVDRMASFRSVDRTVPPAVAPSNPEEILNEARRCLSERLLAFLYLLSSTLSLLLFLPSLRLHARCVGGDVLTVWWIGRTPVRRCGHACKNFSSFFLRMALSCCFGPTLFHLVRDNVAAVKKVAILRFVSDSFDDVLCRLSYQRATFSLQFSELARWR